MAKKLKTATDEKLYFRHSFERISMYTKILLTDAETFSSNFLRNRYQPQKQYIRCNAIYINTSVT